LENPNWSVLGTVKSPHLEKIEVFASSGTESPNNWEKIDSLLYELYNESYRNDDKTFHVSLRLKDDSKGA
jgi:hypothetical protein